MTGYRGRVGLYELLTADAEPRANMCIPADRHRRAAPQGLRDGMRPLRLAGAMKVAEGVTTLDEVLRATPQLVGRMQAPASAFALR